MLALIVAHERDKPILELCIDGIRKHCVGVNRIVVISKSQLSNSAEWMDESTFPFSFQDVASIVGNTNRTGWFFQQLLKLYALSILNEELGIVVDADTVFLRNVTFTTNDKKLLFNTGTEYHQPYFGHISRLLPDLKKMSNLSGICHHMIYSRILLDRMFKQVERIHKKPFWKCMLQCVDPAHYEASGMSEYELYFNWVLKYAPEHYQIRQLSWKNSKDYKPSYATSFDYISIHWYIRK
jgi:hypothetical protein